VLPNENSRRFSSVGSILFVGKTEDGNFFLSDGIEHALDHLANKSKCLIQIYFVRNLNYKKVAENSSINLFKQKQHMYSD
jgi:hypothetical protein